MPNPIRHPGNPARSLPTRSGLFLSPNAANPAKAGRAIDDKEQHKPLFGKPFLRYGQCLSLFSYFFQLGGVLGTKFRDKPDDFVWAFLGIKGEAGAAVRWWRDVVDSLLVHMRQSEQIIDYVVSCECEREKLHITGGLPELLLTHGMNKTKLAKAGANCWGYAVDGSAYGALCPNDFRRLWDASHRKRDEELWKRARNAGLDIPAQQDAVTYAECEAGEVESFLAYCQDYAPALHASLSIG